MKLQNLTVIFIIIILPIILVVSLYINTGIKTIKYQALYDTALLNATHDAIYAFEQNTANNKYSDNAETKRSIIKSSVKMFEKSLANAAGISAYSSDEIEEYIPAIVFGMYDGFYLYAPSYNTQSGKYEHDLKNYVYYSETLDDGTIIRYSLDNYVSVTVKDATGKYIIKEGYLSVVDNSALGTGTGIHVNALGEVKYNGLPIDLEALTDDNSITNNDAKKYFKNSRVFSKWFLEDADLDSKATYLNIGSHNDPEDPNSAFSQHKREIMKEKIESVLNSTITAYSQRAWTQNYKMPKLSEEDWEKIYNNISVTSFFQGKKIGLTKYNGYCVLNSTNHTEYVNPNLLYFIDRQTIIPGDSTKYYHDIRCDECAELNFSLGALLDFAVRPKGYRIGSFNGRKVTETDPSGNTITKYVYDHEELACYKCINGTALDTSQSIYDYVNGLSDWSGKKRSYWTSLARERYNTAKLTALVTDDEIDISFNINNDDAIQDLSGFNRVYAYNEIIQFPEDSQINPIYGYRFVGWNTDPTATTGISTTDVKAVSDKIYYAIWEQLTYTVSFKVSGGGGSYAPITANIGESVTLYTDMPAPIIPGLREYKKWSWTNEGTTVTYDPGESVQFDRDVELWAFASYIGDYHRYIYKVSGVDKNDFMGYENPNYYVPNYTGDVPDGEQFDYWVDQHGNRFEPGVFVSVSDVRNLNPVFKSQEYTLTFKDSINGSDIDSIGVPNGETIDLSDIDNPSRSGYYFVGWSESSSPGGAIVTSVTINGADKELYAIWSQEVAKIGETVYSSLQAAVDSVGFWADIFEGEVTIDLLVDINENITTKDEIDLNLNDHKMTGNITINSEELYINGGVIEGNITKKTSGLVTPDLKLERVNIIGNITNENGDLEILDATITGKLTNNVSTAPVSLRNVTLNGQIDNKGGEMIIENANINSGDQVAIFNQDKIIINGETTITTGNNSCIVTTGGTVTINNGTITNNSSTSPTIDVKRTGIGNVTLTQNGGTINNNGSGYEIRKYTEYKTWLGLGSYEYPTVNLNGGTCGTVKEEHN